MTPRPPAEPGCLFCRLAAKEIPATIVTQNEDVVVFRDLNPQAPTHMLAIPRAHYANVGELVTHDPLLACDVLSMATQTAQAEGLDDGYRVVFNTGQQGGQTVNHVHAHVLGGRHMGWPPG